MKFTIQREKLLSALDLICKVASKNKVLPIYNNVRIIVKDSHITFEGATTESSVRRCTDLVFCDGDGIFLVDAQAFQRYIRNVATEDIKITVDESTCKIQHATGFINLPLVDGKPWADPFAAKGECTEISIPSRIVERLINETPAFHSKDGFMSALSSSCIRCQPTSISLISTDTYKLYYYTEEATCPAPADILVPCDIIPLLSIEESLVKVKCYEKCLVWELGSTTICHSRVNGKYPDVSRIIPTTAPFKVACDRAKLVESTRRVSASVSNRIVSKLKITNDTCTINAVDMDTQRSLYETIPCDSNCEMIVGINASQFITGLSAMVDENVEISLLDPSRPIIFKSKSEAGKTVLVMPMVIPA